MKEINSENRKTTDQSVADNSSSKSHIEMAIETKRSAGFCIEHQVIRRPQESNYDSSSDQSTQTSDKPKNERSPMRRIVQKLNKKRRNFKATLNDNFCTGQLCGSGNRNDQLQLWKDMEYAERQNSIASLDLFRYATFRERLAIGFGVLFMWYAASWQPISVFILAIMASLMGQYSKKTIWLTQMNNSAAPNGQKMNSSLASQEQTLQVSHSSSGRAPEFVGSLTEGKTSAYYYETTSETPGEHLESILVSSGAGSLLTRADASDESFSLLTPLYSLVNPIFDFGAEQKVDDDEGIQLAVSEILKHESNQFLRKSFEINGSAFVLALSQLLAFFIGMSFITWAAKRQASRIKIMYFNSCLHQEVTWYEAIDSASGSGSSLNALVEKYEDGIGMKLALLCYFLGHVALFALTAFYQMFQLASFCMPFVLVVGLMIAYLSEYQAVAIGQHALFGKRSLQLAEEILAAIRTVFAFNGQQKELTRFSMSLDPVYRKSLVKHFYTALNTSLSKFSIFACFSAYCFYAMRLFPPYDPRGPSNKATVLAVMRGAEVSIVNILISIPFMEALQQSKGSIARIYAAIERRSKINASADNGAKPSRWEPSISFRMVQFGYADRSGPTRRRSTLPFLNLPGSPGSGQQAEMAKPNVATRRQSLIDELAGELELERSNSNDSNQMNSMQTTHRLASNNNHNANKGFNQMTSTSVEHPLNGHSNEGHTQVHTVAPKPLRPQEQLARRPTQAAIRNFIGHEIERQHKFANNKRILNYFNLEIRAGQSVALVGPSGSGKSTVLSLVQRLYDITGGQLLIGQNNIKDLSVSWLRSRIGVVTQEPRLFDMTIAENIRLGLCDSDDADFQQPALDSQTPTSEATKTKRENRVMQQVIEAAKAANAHDFIVCLPNGYATRVGSGGVQLSGGQKQRIAIARALIRKPKILLLDESTSALDPESEAQVQTALKAASVGRTTLTVAHRLSTIKDADLIVVMSQGQVVECGSHEELMALEVGCQSGAIYRQMYEEQLRSIRRKQWNDGSLADDAGVNPQKMHNPLGADKTDTKPNDAKADHLDKNPLSRVQFVSNSNSRADNEDLHSNGVASYMDDNSDYDDPEKSSISSKDIEDPSLESKPSAWQLWQFIEMPKWSSLAAIIICLLSGLILPMNLIAHSYLFSAFAYDDIEQIGDYLHVFGLVILSFSTFVFIVTFLQIILPGYVGEKLSIRLRVKLMETLLNKPMFYFDMDANSAGSLCDRFNSYISSIQSIAGTRMATMLEAVATLAAGAVFGFGQNFTLSSFCLSFALLVLITTIIESRIVAHESSLQQIHDAKLAHLMADALSNIKTIASLNKEQFFIRRFTEIIEQRERGVGRSVVWLRTFLTSLKFVMPAMSWSASMYFGCHLLVEGRIDLQTIFIVCPVVLFAVNDTFRALVFLPELLKARNAIERLYKMHREFSPEVLSTLTLSQQLEQQNKLHLKQLAAAAASSPANELLAKTSNPMNPRKSLSIMEPSVGKISEELNGDEQQADEPNRQLVNRRLSNLNALPTYMRRKSSCLNSLVPRRQARGRIEFRGVEFAYPNRPSALILDGFSLSIAPAESVALVGGSGSGKSTTVSILEKFYDYHAGDVTLDGHDLRLVEPNWVRSQIGLVSQEPTLLSYTIGDNIRYGDNSRFVSMDEVVEAARTANIHDFIMSLPDQYDTELSSSSYSSSQLSGGQKQRIAIARALIRNAPILIFDEATSALDNRSESVVQDALRKARKGRTSVTIAHRLATVKDVDKIVVLKDGKVVEVGKHEELMEMRNGHYRSLWIRQESSSEVC